MKFLKGESSCCYSEIAFVSGTFADFELHTFVFDGRNDIKLRNLSSCFLPFMAL